MENSPTAVRERTKQFALRIIRLCNSLPRTDAAHVIGRQLLRSGTSIGANYTSAQRGRSRAEFKAKLGVVLEEADETVYWLELLVASGIVPEKRMKALLAEAIELVKIFASSLRTARGG
jgi:four helix bundle protein